MTAGVKNVVITMGSKGVYANDGENSVLFDSLKVEAIDTTGAGDAFIGGFQLHMRMENRYLMQ